MSANRVICTILFVCVAVALNLHGGPAYAQYMYLDANADSINTESDSLAAAGTVEIDVWIVTNQDRTGTSATCTTEQQLTINSYEVILRAVGGAVSWNGFSNAQAEMSVPLGYRSNDSDLYVGYGGGTALAPGRHKLGTVSIRVMLGSPSLEIVPNTVLGGTFSTSFGSACLGVDGDNTLRLGTDWHDADGVRTGGGSGQASFLEASGSGFLVFLGNFVEGPWSLSVRDRQFSVNGLAAPTGSRTATPSGYAASREMEFLRQASSLADSLRDSTDDLSLSTNVLRTFCEGNSVGARVSATIGKVEVRLPSGVTVILNLSRRAIGRINAQPHGQDARKVALELMAKYLRQGAGLIVTDLGIWTLVPPAKVPQVRQALEAVRAGGDLNQAALKSLSSRDRALMRSPATLVRLY